MLSNYTAKYIKISSGYIGQLVEWPEVVTEGKTLGRLKSVKTSSLVHKRVRLLSLRSEGSMCHLFQILRTSTFVPNPSEHL